MRAGGDQKDLVLLHAGREALIRKDLVSTGNHLPLHPEGVKKRGRTRSVRQGNFFLPRKGGILWREKIQLRIGGEEPNALEENGGGTYFYPRQSKGYGWGKKTGPEFGKNKKNGLGVLADQKGIPEAKSQNTPKENKKNGSACSQPLKKGAGKGRNF